MAQPPYVYTPVYYSPTPYIDPYYLQNHSPYIPNLQVPPLTPPTRQVHFEDEEPQCPVRPRVVSWHAGMPSSPVGPMPYFYPSPPPPHPVPLYTHGRRHSFGAPPVMTPPWATPPPWSAWPGYGYAYPPQPYVPRSLLHPLLSAEENPPPIIFDMSLSTFAPQKIIGRGQRAALSTDELRQPATHPPTTHMRIVCDPIKQWPIELKDRRSEPFAHSMLLQVPAMEPAPPITVGDVLNAIHRAMQTQISHVDWARLSKSDEIEIARAYTRRCRAFPSVEQFEASQGVRRVDYLLKKYMFKGLKRSKGDDGFNNLKLVIGPPD